MTTIDQDEINHLEAQLTVEEKDLAFLYDDAVGAVPFKKGDTLKGNLTFGTGINAMTGFDAVERKLIEDHRIALAMGQLSAYGWYLAQDEVRRTALADLVFNIGLGGLLHWPHFLSYMAAKDYPHAVSEITTNAVWISQVHPVRATRIAQMILTGAWPTDITVAV